ncbi:ABC transporter substrate-binding protein [Shumkonia mesophila]|uniref:ABC transporter substrate-binding protein n=1 Tax=Shumkonia mesophila TaxID=2838854 RepID=UPI00293493ED|nr:ABC transporter substrate-binding protein [Shumkonia mesophila]
MRKMIGMAVAAAAIALAGSAYAADIKVGLSSEPTSMDPHYHNVGPNNMLSNAVFDKLVAQDAAQNKVPGLAESWKQLAPNVWEFKLRQGVKWHDGSPFTAADVKFTMSRAGNVPNSPSSFKLFTGVLSEVEVVDDYTVRMKTKDAFPLMPEYMSVLIVVSKKHGENATTNDYNSGKAMIGTGPYKFVEWVKGDRIVYTKNPDYWGPKPEWDKVTVKPISDNAARVAALLAGDVDLVDFPSPSDLPNLKKNPNISLAQVQSTRLIYLHYDTNRDKSPFIFDNSGKPLEKNPLKDLRVRQAMSLAINRKAIAERVMDGLAVPSGQLMPPNVLGAIPDRKADEFNPEKAKKLLKEAGYPDGFKITIHGPNNRYINDEKVTQAIAQALTRVGIKTDVVTMPSGPFFSKGTALEFSLLLVGWNSGTGEPSDPLRALVSTYDKATGTGATNRGRYSNPALDQMVADSLKAPNREEWVRLSQGATAIAMNDLGIIPLYFQVNVWAMRKGLDYVARADEYTQIQDIVSKKK